MIRVADLVHCIKKPELSLNQKEREVCLSCSDLDHLVFLPAGDNALTRRSKKHSRLHAVVLKWNRRRRRSYFTLENQSSREIFCQQRRSGSMRCRHFSASFPINGYSSTTSTGPNFYAVAKGIRIGSCGNTSM